MMTCSRKQVYIIVIFEIEHEQYVILLCFFSQYIDFILVMFYIFVLQATDSVFDLASYKSIDIDVDEIMCNIYIGYSLDSIKMIEKTSKKINEDILCLLFISPHTNDIKAKVDVLVKRYQALKVSRSILNQKINSFMIL